MNELLQAIGKMRWPAGHESKPFDTACCNMLLKGHSAAQRLSAGPPALHAAGDARVGVQEGPPVT